MFKDLFLTYCTKRLGSKHEAELATELPLASSLLILKEYKIYFILKKMINSFEPGVFNYSQ